MSVQQQVQVHMQTQVLAHVHLQCRGQRAEGREQSISGYGGLTQSGHLWPRIENLLAQPIQSPMRSQPHDRCQLTSHGGRHG